MAIAMLDVPLADGPGSTELPRPGFPSAQAARTVGVGFVVGERHVVTCAHVVNVALGRDLLRQDKPDELVTLRLPMCGDVIREARIDAWLPPPHSGIAGDDIAGLVITGEGLPSGLRPARLSLQTPSGIEVRLFGYPDEVPRPEGGWVIGRLQGEVGNGLLQLDVLTCLSHAAGQVRAPGAEPTQRVTLNDGAIAVHCVLRRRQPSCSIS